MIMVVWLCRWCSYRWLRTWWERKANKRTRFHDEREWLRLVPLLDRLGGVLTAFGSRRTKNEIKKKTRTRSQMSRHIFERFTTGMIQKDNLHIVVPLVLRFSVDNNETQPTFRCPEDRGLRICSNLRQFKFGNYLVSRQLEWMFSILPPTYAF